MYWLLSENEAILIHAPVHILQVLSESIVLLEEPNQPLESIIILEWNQQFYSQHKAQYWDSSYTTEDSVYSKSEDGFFLVRNGFFLSYSKNTNQASFYIEQELVSDYLTYSYPLLQLLVYLSDLRGLVPLHAAVIGNDNGYVLIPGKQNSGKSTTSASWALHGGKLLTDDFCFVNPLQPTKMYGYYPSIRLREQSLNLLKDILEVDQLKQKNDSKYFYQLRNTFPENIVSVGLVKAIFCIQINSELPLSHTLSDAQTAYKNLASSFVFSLQYGASSGLCLQAIKKITSILPVYLINLSMDPKENYEYLQKLMDSISPIDSSISEV
jgi:hypothetical protein